jgi:hypothetical protein
MKKWDVLRITTEGFVVEAENEEEARNKVANMGRFCPTVDIDVEEADPNEELFEPA